MIPIDRMVMNAVRCVSCGAKYGECDCHVTMECNECHRKTQATRDDSWPKGTRKVMTYCPLCKGDDIEFIDKEGNKLSL